MGYRGDAEVGRVMRMTVRGYMRYSHPSYLINFFSVLLSPTDRPSSSTGLDVRQYRESRPAAHG